VGQRNVLVDGSSGSGKTAVCHELRRRGYEAFNGDRELGYLGDPRTVTPVDEPAVADEAHRAAWVSEHPCWRGEQVQALAADQREPVSFFCGGSRNTSSFLQLSDAVLLLDVDLDTLHRRLDGRPADEWAGRGRTAERELVVRLHESGADLPPGVRIDATRPMVQVVDELLRRCGVDLA
jgi:adenylate kinase family enzyme